LDENLKDDEFSATLFSPPARTMLMGNAGRLHKDPRLRDLYLNELLVLHFQQFFNFAQKLIDKCPVLFYMYTYESNTSTYLKGG